MAEELPSSQVVLGMLERGKEVVTCTKGEVEAVHTLLSIMDFVFRQWLAISSCVSSLTFF